MADVGAFSMPGGQGNFKTKIEIRVECAHLKNEDYNSKSDPFVVLFIKEGQDPNTPWAPLAHTETVHDNLNPKFARPFLMDYVFEKAMHMKFEVYDQDSKVNDLRRDLQNQQFLGYGESELAALVHAPGQTQTLALRTRKGKKQKDGNGRLSMITFHVEEVSQNADVIHMELAAKGLPKMDWFGSGDPFLEIHRLREDGNWVKVWKSEVIKNSKKPRWKRKTLPMQMLNNGDPQRPIKIIVFDWESKDEPQYIGELQTSVHDMSANVGGTLEFRNPNKKKKQYAGDLVIHNMQIEKRHTFMEYLKGGMDMQLLVAIDFTGSNGHPLDPGTLHFRTGPNRMSPYLHAIRSVGNILHSYDTDGQIPVWGFGAVYNGRVDHCFPMNMNPQNPEVTGVEGIVQAYHNLLDNQIITFSGPTLFQTILRNASQIAAQPGLPNRVSYSILLILTDGVINDMQQTVDAVVQASGLPLSIIIVGIGNADFESMDRLDGDDGVLTTAQGQRAQRDIVQFVPYRRFRNLPPGALAEETLKEVPEQFLAFMRKHNIDPMPPTQAVSQDQAEQMLLSQQTIVGGDMFSNAPPPNQPPAQLTLPPGWEQSVDQASGRVFYVNAAMQKTQWEFPT